MSGVNSSFGIEPYSAVKYQSGYLSNKALKLNWDFIRKKYLSFLKKYKNNLLFSLKFVTHFGRQDNMYYLIKLVFTKPTCLIEMPNLYDKIL